jgi:hypothetical protein
MKKAYQIFSVLILLVNVCEGQTMDKNITWFHTLKEVSITPNARPDTVSGSKEWMIFDFTFCEKGILLLTYNKNEKKCALQLLKHNNELELISNEINKPLGFYEAAQKSIFLETKNEVLEVSCIGNTIELVPFKEELFYGTVRPIKGMNACAYYMNNWRPDTPEFSYLRIDRNTKKIDTIGNIRNQYLYEQYYSEYKFLSFKDRCEINRQARATGENKYDLAVKFTGFTHSFWWKPLYSPLFMQKDTALVFDHYQHQIQKYRCGNAPIKCQEFDFHKKKEYKQILLQDYFDESLFALFLKNGKTTLFKVNTENGDLAQSYVLFYKYVSKIKVNNGVAYYLYRPYESSQNTFLYAEVLR